MSWVTNKRTLDTALKSLKFKQVPNNLTSEEAFQAGRYHLEVTGIKTTDITDNNAFEEYYVDLSVSYIVTSNEEYDSMVDSFKNVLSAIRDLDYYAGFTEDAEITRMEEDNKKIIARASFVYGVSQCQ